MKFLEILNFLKKSRSKSIESKMPDENNKSHMKIDDLPDDDYEMVKVSNIGLTVPFGDGVVLLSSQNGKQFPVSSFSSEVAGCISNFIEQKRDLPTIYNMFEQVCEERELFLVKVKLYQSGQALRANLYFTGKKDLVLRNFRASDAIALATFYNIPILIRKNLLEENIPK